VGLRDILSRSCIIRVSVRMERGEEVAGVRLSPFGFKHVECNGNGNGMK